MEERIYGSGHGPRPEDESESSYTIEQSFNADASRSRDSSPVGETEQERVRRYQQATLGEVSSPEFWQSVHHFPESDTSEEWTRREEALRGGEEGREEALRGGEGVREESLRGEEVGEDPNVYDENDLSYNLDVFTRSSDQPEPEGEPRHNRSIVGRCRGGRNPPTYPALTEDEISGGRYPGSGVSLEIFSDKERMCRLLECLEARMAGCAVRGEQERYDSLLRERDDLDALVSVASDIRPEEGNPMS